MAHVVDTTYGRNRDLGQVTDPALLDYYRSLGYTVDGTVAAVTPGAPAHVVPGIAAPYGAAEGEVLTVHAGGVITAPLGSGAGNYVADAGDIHLSALVPHGASQVDALAAVQAAIDAAPDGSTIVFPPTTTWVSGTIRLNPFLTYRGNQFFGSTVKLMSSATGVKAVMATNRWLTTTTGSVFCDNPVTVRDLTIDGNKSATATASPGCHGLVSMAWQSEFDRLQVINCAGDGIHLADRNAAGTAIANTAVENRISNNKILDCDGNGIYVEDYAHSLTDGFCLNNVVATCGGVAIRILRGAGWSVEGNHTYTGANQGLSAIWVSAGFATSILNNYVDSYGQASTGPQTVTGIRLDQIDGRGSIITNNRIALAGPYAGNTYRHIYVEIGSGSAVSTVLVKSNVVYGQNGSNETGLAAYAPTGSALTLDQTGNDYQNVPAGQLLSTFGPVTVVTSAASGVTLSDTDARYIGAATAATAVGKARQAARAFDFADFGAVSDLIDRYSCMAVTAATAGNAVLTDVGLPAPVQSVAFTATTGGVISGGQTLYYVITAKNQYGETTIGNEQSIVIPAGTNTNRVTISWTAVPGATAYNIYRSTSSGSGYLFVATQASTSVNYSDNNVTVLGAAPPSTNTTPAGLFTPADVGKLVGIPLSGASFAKWDGTTSYYSTAGTITAYIDPNNVKVSQATTTAVTRGNAQYGTDNGAAMQAAATAARVATQVVGTTATLFMSGRYATSMPLVDPTIGWGSYMSILGNGTGKSKVAVIQPSPTSAWVQGKAPVSAPYVDCTFADFEIDGSSIGGSTGYNVAYKGFYMQSMQRMIIRGLYVHDFPATGIGCDYLVDCVIEGCITNRNGRMNLSTSQQLGSSGIGIGTGLFATENTSVVGCTAVGNGNYGIFAEKNGNVFSKGVRVVGCHAEGNQYGIGDAGNLGMVIANNECYANTKDGINIGPGTVSAPPGYGGLVTGNLCYSNTRDGIRLDGTNTTATTTTQGRQSIRGNRCRANTGNGITVVGGAQAMPYIRVRDNECDENTGWGISVTGGAGTLNDLHIRGNSVKQNTAGAITYTTGTFTNLFVEGNTGYSLGPVAVTVTASPMTYTAGPTPEDLYIDGGTVSAIVKGGVTLATSTGRLVRLGPGEAVTVTYSVAPTLSADRR